MSQLDELCDWCGEFVDPIGCDTAVARTVDQFPRLWCSPDHERAWYDNQQSEIGRFH